MIATDSFQLARLKNGRAVVKLLLRHLTSLRHTRSSHQPARVNQLRHLDVPSLVTQLRMINQLQHSIYLVFSLTLITYLALCMQR